MKKTLQYIAINSLLILGFSGISFAQDFLAPIQAKIDSIKQQQSNEQANYAEQKQQLQVVTSSSSVNASTTQARDIQLRNLIEKKIGKPLDTRSPWPPIR